MKHALAAILTCVCLLTSAPAAHAAGNDDACGTMYASGWCW